jgi:hypothetical protein
MPHQLQKLADTLCRGFSGWHLQHDRHTLTALGSGRLEIDLIKKTCRFQRNYIPILVIVEVLSHRLRHHLVTKDVAPGTIGSATLSIAMTSSDVEEPKDSSVMWFGDNDGFIRCKMKIQCRISTADGDYTSEHSAQVEWPRQR